NTLSQRLPGQQISVQQPLTPKEKKEALNASLDKMNSKFFMQEPKAMPQDLAGSQDLANESLKTSMRDPKLMSETSAGRNYSGGKMNLPEGMQVVELETVSHQSADADPAMLDAQVMDSAMKPEAKLIATTAGLAAQAMKAMPKAEVRSAEAMSVDTAQMQVGMNADVMPMNVLSKANAQSSNNDLMSFSDKGSSLEDSDLKSLSDPSSSKEGDPFAVSKDAGQVDPLRGNAKSLAAGGAAGAMLGARHGQNDPNVQALMNRAQILIRDGGGEMKVTMTPEGMGTVDLKVVVENGKVNVEMLADSPHAKKLIESASNDLKSHLIESKLDVGAIKVDLASRSSTNLDNSSGQQQQKQMDSQPDHRGREQAQQFFNQFREGNLSQRGGMTEMPDFRSYSPRKSVALEPAKRPDPTARKNEGGRISLVA
ncbi:MAG: flagellar hook-length control protein FliK, partial [Pseudobdellovibrionaceae bacterium]